jgi:cobalamin biosynthesis protein CobW
MSQAIKVPVTVVTGFLGAGKTTLIRHLLENANGRRLALIINEFGDLGVDGEILKGCGEATCSAEDVLELTNGCLCCTVADDFVPTLEMLLDRPEPPDHIIIETSGLALPKPLVKAFQWRVVRSRTTVDGVIAMVDGPAVSSGLFAADPDRVDAQRREDQALDHESSLEELFEDQLAFADLVIIGKSDLMADDDELEVREIVEKETRDQVKALSAVHGRLDPALVLGLGRAVEDEVDRRFSHHDAEEGDHDHDDFDSLVFEMDAIADPADFSKRVGRALGLAGVLRIKGVLEVAGKPARLVVQGVGPRVEHFYDRPWREGEVRAGRLVVIGLDSIDRRAVADALQG